MGGDSPLKTSWLVFYQLVEQHINQKKICWCIGSCRGVPEVRFLVAHKKNSDSEKKHKANVGYGLKSVVFVCLICTRPTTLYRAEQQTRQTVNLLEVLGNTSIPRGSIPRCSLNITTIIPRGSMKWYLSKIKYLEPEASTGNLKPKTDVYLIQAISYADAEKISFEKCPQWDITLELRTLKLTDVFIFGQLPDNNYFLAIVEYEIFNERTQKSKVQNYSMIVEASDLLEAYRLLKEKLGSFSDYKIKSIARTDILEVNLIK